MASTNRDEISRLELLHAAHPDGLVFPHLADAYRRAGRYAQAESVLNAGLRHHADYSSAHVVLGRLRLDQGKRREAENAFQRVLQLDPHNHVALEFLGRLTADEGRTDEALRYFRRLATLKPSDELADQIADLEHGSQQASRTPSSGEARTDSGTGSGTGTGTRPATGSGPGSTGSESGAARGNGGGERSEPDRDPGDPVAEFLEPGEVVTETMAELYARQGLHERAEAVYRQLSERNPEDARLRKKVVEAAARQGGATGEPAEGTAPTAAPGTASGRSSSIRTYLAGVLEWSPGAGEAEPPPAGPPAADGDRLESESAAASPGWNPELEPWAAAPVTEPEEATTPLDGGTDPSTGLAVGGQEAAGEPEAAGDPDPWEVQAAPSRPGRPAPTPAELGLAEDDLEGADARTRALIALTDMLVGLLEYRDPFFRGSSSLTRLLATNVAEELGLDPSARVNLALAAVLRDLGRLALGGRLVESQELSRTPEARRKIERHVDLALHLMEGIELPRSVTLAVRHHHERWDGAGYPDGLAGHEIPLVARVLAAVDSFAAMVSPRPYRLPRKVPDAAREMEEGAGTQYDPVVVEALLRVLERRDQPHLGFVQRHHILLVSPDQPGAVVTAAKLCTSGYLAEVAVDPDAARERLRRVPVAALVVSAESGADEAEELVRELRLDPLFAALPLVVVDAGTVALRVRLLESGADVCFPPGISYGELQGTLGALVRRTLRSRDAGPDGDDEASWLALQGDVQDFPLAWLLQVMKYDSRTAGVGIRTATEQGAIYIENGDAVHARIRGGASGEEALKEMLQWRKGRFTVQPDARPKERSIEQSIMHLLLTQAVEEDHAAAGVFGAVTDHG